MENHILVAYATKYGATAGIAEKIGQVLKEQGLRADILEVESHIDLSQYNAVVLGSGVYAGRWNKGAAKFLRANEKELAKRQVWLFSDGPTDKGKTDELLQGWRFPGNLQPIADRIHPRDIKVFKGVLDPEKLGFFSSWIIKKAKVPTGDFRDWDEIISWANGIADSLKKEQLPKASGM